MSDKIFYVAEDPKQPGTAFAACVDKPEFASLTAQTLSDWTRQGGIIRRVDGETMRAMLSAWKRPQPSLF